MTHNVSRESLEVFANLAFTRIKLKADGDTQFDPASNLSDSSHMALFNLICGDIEGPQTPSVWRAANALTIGFQLGLAVAAEIITHGHDTDALCTAVEATYTRAQESCWPECLSTPEEAA